jgi:hypothetical protein
MNLRHISVSFLLILLGGASPVWSAEAFALKQASPTQLTWSASSAFPVVHLRLAGGEVVPVDADFRAGQPISLALAESLPDGSYSWELTGSYVPNDQIREQVAQAREAGDDAAVESLLAGAVPPGARSSGSFRVQNGTVYWPGNGPEETPAVQKSAAPAAPVTANDTVPRDIVQADDLIVQGNLAVGFDAVNGESFGFDTIRLKENNLRIHFDDTSSSAGFAANDWRLVANDSASGGANYFGIEDATAARTLFRIEAGAPADSFVLSSAGRVGLHTLTPVLDLHLKTPNTPAIRLEQDNSGGFVAQTWDVAGNEANFFVRDVTGGSKLPFRIRPGAPTSSIDIAANGNVGVGTASPAASLHVGRSDGTTKLAIVETSTVSQGRTLLELKNNGNAKMSLINTAKAGDEGGGGWQWLAVSGSAVKLLPVTPTPGGVVEFMVQRGGRTTVAGPMFAESFHATSDRGLKSDINPVAPREILERVVSMPIAEWRFTKDENATRHIGPMAQDFNRQFGLGDSGTTINLMDSTGVALAAVQGLHAEIAERDAQIRALKEKSDALEAQVQALAREFEALRKP